MKDGYINDFISGREVKASPEEIEAVQVFSKILVEDYDYPKDVIQTHPQFRVKVRPSDRNKSYPVDIAVFSDSDKNEDDIVIIVECKKKNRKDGKSQLQDYLRFSKAPLGVWFNGEERLFLKKLEKSGRIDFEEVPNIPKYGQRIEDVGKYKRKDLKKATNLKSVFRAMRNYLAGNVVGATRDEVFAQQLINLIFCKLYDEKFTKPDDVVTFRAGIDEDHKAVKDRIIDLFGKVKSNYSDVIDDSDTIMLDEYSLMYIVGELQQYCLTESSRDAVGDAFEVFIGHALKGAQGQFFTPRNVVKMVVEMIDPKPTDKVIDPACGSGGFLVECLRYMWDKADKEYEDLNWPKHEIEIEKQKIAIKNLRGIDKDYFLSKVAKAYMALLGDGRGGIHCENSLENPTHWGDETTDDIKLNQFDIVITNPPFGSKIPVKGEELLKQYDLGYSWKFDKKTGEWSKNKLKAKETPQILFIERCLQLLKNGGKLAIVLPDGILGNDSLIYLREWMLNKAKILAVVDVPIETFMPYTSTKTSILFLQKQGDESFVNTDYKIFMAICETCGHNRRGQETDSDDISEMSVKYKEWMELN
ncbi:MAG: N-6 DNA methylase [Candidatus Marinimicrobia bacterium]|nr:N-6 DNA methylase [Candidatus Neomarinimicrobiota bacterium]